MVPNFEEKNTTEKGLMGIFRKSSLIIRARGRIWLKSG